MPRCFRPGFGFVAGVALVIAAVLSSFVAGSNAARAEEPWLTLPAPAPLPAAARSGFAEVNGVKIYFAIYGAGPPLVFLHGGLANANYWGNQVPEFARDHQVILIESRGHGRSTRDAQPYTYELMASDVIATLDQLKVPKASIVGWSDGAIIGLVIAIAHPDRLDRLYAFGANTNPAGLKDGIDKNPTFSRYIEEAGQQYAKLSSTPNDYQGFLDAIGKMWASEPDIKDSALATIKAPVAIADGEHDEAIRRDHTEAIAKAVPGAKLVILPGLSHFAMLQDPAAFNASVRSFLDAR